MPPLHVIYYLDVCSSWCNIADRALARIEEKYGADLSVEWRIAQIADFGPIPYSREQMRQFYDRTERITGIRLNENWVDGPECTTAHANRAAEAVRALGAQGSQVRRGLSNAAVVEGKPIGRREVAIEEAARLSGLPLDQIAGMMDSAEVRDRIAQTTREFADLALTQRPSFVMRNTIDDLAVFSGLYTFEALDAAMAEMLHAARGYTQAGEPR